MKLLKSAILGLSVAVLCGSPLTAATVTFAPGDLVLGFQKGSADSDLYLVSLGSVTTFKNAVTDQVNITNIAADLTTAFGGTWADQTDLYMGVFSMFSRTSANPNGDPGQTVYISKARPSVGTQSSALATISVAQNNTIGTAISGVQTSFDLATAANNANGAIMLTSASTYDDNNPPTAGSLSWGVFNILGVGTQTSFATGTFGSFANGSIGTSEAALDVYRIDGESVNPGTQNASFTGVGSSIGSVTIDGSGNVSFVAAVPEPSTYSMLAIAALGVGAYLYRRRKA